MTYRCRFCQQTATVRPQDIDAARACEADEMRYDAELTVSPTDAELMDRFGRDICPSCAGD